MNQTLREEFSLSGTEAARVETIQADVERTFSSRDKFERVSIAEALHWLKPTFFLRTIAPKVDSKQPKLSIPGCNLADSAFISIVLLSGTGSCYNSAETNSYLKLYGKYWLKEFEFLAAIDQLVSDINYALERSDHDAVLKLLEERGTSNWVSLTNPKQNIKFEFLLEHTDLRKPQRRLRTK